MSKRLVVGLSIMAVGACGGTTSDVVGSQTQATQAAEADGGRGPERHRHGPPPEAFDACNGKDVGATCMVSFGNDAVDEAIGGICAAPPPDASDARIACRPDHAHAGNEHRGRPAGPPPEEAFAACSGKTSGATCSVVLGDRTLEGHCKEAPPGVSETRLACAPPRLDVAPGRP